MSKVSSDDLKTLGMCWCRYTKQLDLVCTEDPQRNADVLGTDSSIQCRSMVEIETKISIADLRNDLKKTHRSWTVVNNKHERLGMAFRKEEKKYENFNGYNDNEGNPIKIGPDKDEVHGVDWDDKEHSCIPSQFYFMVPVSLKDKALAFINEHYPHCGLMTGSPVKNGYYHTRHVSVVKKAPVLHKRLIAKGIKNQICSRIVSELCGHRLDKMRLKWENVTEEVTNDECESNSDQAESTET